MARTIGGEAGEQLLEHSGHAALEKKAAEPAPRLRDSGDRAAVNPAAARILVVDDEVDIADSLSEFLTRKEGYRVEIVQDGRQAIAYLEKTIGTALEVDLVLLDMRMPGLSGLDVLDWIRGHPKLRYTRVVLLTAAASNDEKVQALSAGADDYITKPYYMQELLARVKTILRTQQLEKQLHQQSRQLAELNRISQAVAATLETSQVYATAIRGVDAVLEVEMAAVLIVEGGRLHCQHVRHYKGAIPSHIFPSTDKGAGILGLAWSEQETICLNHVAADTRYDPTRDSPIGYSVRSMLATPLTVRGRPVGVLAAYNKRTGEFTEVDIDLFSSLASSVSEAIENAWLFQRVRLRHQELLEGRNTLQALIDGIPDPIYTISDDWKLVVVNKAKADQLGATPESLSGRICFRVFYNRQQPCEHCTVALTLNDKAEQHWPVRWIEEDHLPREWEVSAYPIPGKQASSARAVLVWQDKTEERRLENSLMQAGKLAAIGQLAAGVAHEINNPLTAINANAQMLKMVMPVEDENYESVDLIVRAGERAAKVVRGLLDFARQEQYSFTTGDLTESIQEALDLVNYQLQSAKITVTKDFDDALPYIVASWEHLKSVWLNLLLNARDALLHTNGNRQLEVIARPNKDGQTIQVVIHDNGKGMTSAETLHIFEPFYTTKGPGQGTGLGLATCHRIIEQHSGEISVASKVGEGTSFLITLPIQRPDSSASGFYLK
ncbi:putative Multi-sensor hybrid histidine kinase [Candidatus Promineifilum breve]|uniref:histidine kinase n=1 Tax=Candidatus Promineifilum breve TaxID=1806508 RepID=A0A170PDN4_9CHLR|nr:response regulator [Candidatus Promineifilum breve]CUS02117.2 putative Multi-sensor hybrid histidine kinase [Candidatus Promineifilum breve]